MVTVKHAHSWSAANLRCILDRDEGEGPDEVCHCSAPTVTASHLPGHTAWGREDITSPLWRENLCGACT